MAGRKCTRALKNNMGRHTSTPSEELPPGYKMTELGPLPEGWEVARLGETADLIMGQSPPSSTYNTEMKGLPFLQGKADFGDIHPNPTKWCSQPLKIAKPNDVLVSVRAPVGDVNLADKEYCIGRGLASIRVRTKLVDAHFIYYYLIFSKEKLQAKGAGSTFQSINKDILQRFPVPLPPLPEQQAIAEILRAVQRAKEATERVIAALRELKKSLMRHLFTHGPVPVDQADRVALRETELGSLPEGWEVARLGDLFEIQQGKALSPKARAGARKRPFLRTANVLWGRIDLSALDEMHFEKEEEKRLALIPGDLLVCEGGDVGRTALWEGQLPLMLYQNHLHRLRAARADIAPLFYMYWMQAAWTLFDIYGGTGNRTTIPNLSKSRLAALLAPLPPLPEQQAIAEILRAVDCKIEAEEARQRALEALFRTLLHDLMTARLRLPQAFITRFAEDAP